MAFKYDIFISYGHIDDDPATGEVKGWVDYLVEELPKLMQTPLGYVPKIWRDEQSLGGHHRLTEAIKDGIERSLLFVPVMTPRYVLSDWCRRELEMFCASPAPVCPSVEGFRSRVFKVIKTPLVLEHVRDKEPKELRENIGYDFYMMDGKIAVGLSHDSEQTSVKYFGQLRKLAWEMAEMLSQMKPDMKMPDVAAPASVGHINSELTPNHEPPAHEPSGGGEAKQPTKFVYLAETTSDVSDEREKVSDELRQRGYGVLPERQTKLPVESYDVLSAAVRAHLERCCLSVHLIGSAYGSNPEDGDERSVVRIQEEVAAEHSAPDFRRLIWMAQGLEVKGQKQKDFVAELQGKVGEGTELLQTSLEELKTRIVEKLDPPKPPPAPPSRGKRKERLKQIYLICEDDDSDLVWPIKQYLYNLNFEVITKLDDGSYGENGSLMEYHRKNLKECDAALIYFGGGDEPWVQKNLDDLDKAYGYGREDDWCASAVYVGAPDTKQKQYFLTRKVPYIIRNPIQFNPDDLRDFVNAVQSAEGGQE